MVVKATFKKLAVLTSAAALGYLLFLSLFTYSSVALVRDAKDTYEMFKRAGLTEQVEQEYRGLLSRAENLTSSLRSPLLSPIIKLSGRENELNDALDLFDFSKGFLEVAPEFAGFNSPKRYFVAFQNPAEARGTGGLIGAFAILKFDRGAVEIEQVGSNYLLALQDEMPVKLPREFYRIYGDHPAWWPNSNMSPHFPYAGKIWMGLWKKQYDDELDGAITLDPIVLRDLLAKVGSVEVRGVTISKENVVTETLSESYLRYRSENESRKQYLVEIIQAVIEKSFSNSVNRVDLIWAIRKSILQNRVLLFSTNDSIQKSIERAPISGSLDLVNSNEFRLVIQNTAGNKMDYYINRYLRLDSKSCRDKRITQATIKISNTAPADVDLPDIYYGRLDRENPLNTNNSTSLAVFLYGPPGAKLIAAAEKQTGLSAGFLKKERRREALVIPLELNAGESREFTVDFKGGIGRLTAYAQPLVLDQETEIIDNCHI